MAQREHCGICKNPSEADNGCPRCGRELCMEHGLFADSRCAVCEDDFTVRRKFLRERLSVGRLQHVAV